MTRFVGNLAITLNGISRAKAAPTAPVEDAHEEVADLKEKF